ncbi:hypothetical protein AB4259_15250 [Vibrio amylolyticus]|uniref:hypothetical protein n=1 Tax=Vibrio amylolyticus TaxID=2847292 RepID=UPI003553910B
MNSTSPVEYIQQALACLYASPHNFERRDNQVRLMNDLRCVWGATGSQSKMAVCEADSGSGTSIAYLVSSIAVGLSTESQVVIVCVSPSKRSQILHSDWPILQSLFSVSITLREINEPSSYVCIERIRMTLAITMNHYN